MDIYLLIFITTIISNIFTFKGPKLDIKIFLSSLFTFVIFYPMWEEVFFRFYMIDFCQYCGLSLEMAKIISSIFFGLIHFPNAIIGNNYVITRKILFMSIHHSILAGILGYYLSNLDSLRQQHLYHGCINLVLYIIPAFANHFYDFSHILNVYPNNINNKYNVPEKSLRFTNNISENRKFFIYKNKYQCKDIITKKNTQDDMLNAQTKFLIFEHKVVPKDKVDPKYHCLDRTVKYGIPFYKCSQDDVINFASKYSYLVNNSFVRITSMQYNQDYIDKIHRKFEPYSIDIPHHNTHFTY